MLTEVETAGARRQADEPILVAPAPRVTVKRAALCTGLSEKAIRGKIDTGVWVEGREYFRDPQGGVWVDLKGVMQWVGRGRA